MKIKRTLITILFVIAFFSLQNTLVNYIKLGNISPNICLILITTIAYCNGSVYGTVFGFIMGLLFDIFSGGFLGFYSILYVITGYLCGLLNKFFFDYNFELKIPSLMFLSSSLIHNLLIYVCFFLLDGDLNFLYYFKKIVIPEIIYTFIAGVFIYRILYMIDQKISLDERKADGYFVSRN